MSVIEPSTKSSITPLIRSPSIVRDPIMTSYIGRLNLPVSVTFDLQSHLSVVSPSVARSLGHPESVLQFSEILTGSYQGRSLMTDVGFEVACIVNTEVVIGLNWIAAWQIIGCKDDAPIPNYAFRLMSVSPGDTTIRAYLMATLTIPGDIFAANHPYLSVMLTLATVTRLPSVMEHLAQFFATIPSNIFAANHPYLSGRSPVTKAPSIHLAWEFAQNPSDHSRFVNMLRVSPEVFHVLLDLIEDHAIFQNNSNNAQAPVQLQLAVTLYRMGRYGNGASLEDIARYAGISEGSVEKFTERCFTAIEALHDAFVRFIVLFNL
ncbi:hypothetical protein EV702DRAFT_1201320 [Suillus placidus]|uniref:Uncharacterized protein n=1 Tax=Suillus placidus TaxID=48579 RepID=A0A9P6ZNC6_9AGAM|nr:hypothetical protein EV702DRAFT_1201320 [Suillus placidus]